MATAESAAPREAASAATAGEPTVTVAPAAAAVIAAPW
jgi:hypothetical protein